MPTRGDLDELARENKSLREALTAMATERGTGALSYVKRVLLMLWLPILQLPSSSSCFL